MDSADQVFAWADRLSDRIHLQDQHRTLVRQINNAQTQCGSCTQWMTPACPREVHSNKTGRSTGPSSTAIKCDRFVMSASDAQGIESVRQKLAGIEAELAKLG